MKVIISCGHNLARNWYKTENGRWALGLYKDQGAVAGANTEYQFVKKVANELSKVNTGKIDIVFVPEGLNLQDRIKWINTRYTEHDLLIELHMDSIVGNAEGCSTWFVSGSLPMENMAKKFQKEYTRLTGIKGRGVHGDKTNRLGSLGIVRDTKPLALLLEMGFISNVNDRDRVWVKGADALYQSILKII